MELRPLGNTGIQISTVALGTWPMAGMTSLNVNEADSIATIHAAIDAGVNFFDSAYCYGANGESDKLIAKALKGKPRERFVIATKGGIHWEADGSRGSDASPKTIRRECEASLRRLETECVELFYLHGPDPNTPIAETAGEMKRLLDEGKTQSVGVSNVTLEQMQQFATVCPIAAYQPCYNMLQREIETDRLPWCRANHVSVCNYWPLMKGLLTAKFSRDHKFDPRDGRPKYPMFQGEEWQKNQDFLDELRAIAAETGHTVAQVAVNWTIHQPGITSAFCGAKRPEQIRDTAGAMGWKLSEAHFQRIAAAIVRRGKIVSKHAV